MGGRTGLNILPHKSWHVWNRENRARVERDEAEESKRVERERWAKRAAEALDRRNALLRRAVNSARAQEDDVHPHGDAVPHLDTSTMHANGEREKERELVAHRERGKAATRTSDRRFDAQFRFGADGSASSAPWYASGPARSSGPGAMALPSRVRMEREEDERLRADFKEASKPRLRRQRRWDDDTGEEAADIARERPARANGETGRKDEWPP